jgi:protein associated with RNAse G/E
MITVNSRNFDGTIRKSWQCELIEQRDSLLIAIGEFDTDIEHPDLGHIRKGTISHEYFWLDRWYNIFRFHDPSGELRNFYCNISRPPMFKDGILDYVDLDIDVVIESGFNVTVLDREDYERSASTFGYSAEIHAKVDGAVSELLEVFSRRQMPGLPELFATSDAAARECG